MSDRHMTDDEVLALANRIRRRRLNEARRASIDHARGIMIRWDNPGAAFGESYTGISVGAEDVRRIVHEKLDELIRADSVPTRKSSAARGQRAGETI